MVRVHYYPFTFFHKVLFFLIEWLYIGTSKMQSNTNDELNKERLNNSVKTRGVFITVNNKKIYTREHVSLGGLLKENHIDLSQYAFPFSYKLEETQASDGRICIKVVYYMYYFPIEQWNLLIWGVRLRMTIFEADLAQFTLRSLSRDGYKEILIDTETFNLLSSEKILCFRYEDNEIFWSSADLNLKPTFTI